MAQMKLIISPKQKGKGCMSIYHHSFLQRCFQNIKVSTLVTQSTANIHTSGEDLTKAVLMRTLAHKNTKLEI